MTEPDLVAEPLFDEPPVVAAGSESRWAKRRKLTLADLIGRAMGVGATWQSGAVAA